MRISHITYSDFRISQITIARYRRATVATQRAFRFFAIFLYLFINYATGNHQMIIIFDNYRSVNLSDTYNIFST